MTSSIANIKSIVSIDEERTTSKARERRGVSLSGFSSDGMLPTTSKGSAKGARSSSYRSYSFLPQYLRRIVKVSIC